MKKLVLIIAALFAFSVVSFADEHAAPAAPEGQTEAPAKEMKKKKKAKAKKGDMHEKKAADEAPAPATTEDQHKEGH